MVWGCEQVATCRLGLTIREAVKPEDFHELNPLMYVCKAVIAYYLIHSLAGSAAAITEPDLPPGILSNVCNKVSFISDGRRQKQLLISSSIKFCLLKCHLWLADFIGCG